MNVVNFPKRRASSDLPPLSEGCDYDLQDVAVGIEIALAIRNDTETAKFLLSKIQQAVNCGQYTVYLSLSERLKYLDYLDILYSPENTELRIQLADIKYG